MQTGATSDNIENSPDDGQVIHGGLKIGWNKRETLCRTSWPPEK